MNLKLIDEINILVDRKLVIWLNVWAMVMFFVLLVGGFGLFLPPEGSVPITALGLLSFFITLVLTFFLHEWIHGIFFKIFAPGSKVQYGFKIGMLYAANPGTKYNKQQFTVIVTMPFVIITLLVFLSFIFPINRVALYLLFAIHTSGCVGDFYYCYKLWRNKNRPILIEDTAEGIKIFEVLKTNNTIER
ncbi:DUF3267 domain-containing protein [Gracilibacillus saliphilus]|uniref:DUF3267 domain-containing protein n=1 Tax=Gracilibacillus saliphilus TaxID=543890 RepID=UPI0013CF8AD9|nr:DUF3267 domain-containing protein [Gracilibacillus saliphilus]